MKKLFRIALAAGLVLFIGLGISNLFLFRGTPFESYPDGDPEAAALRPALELKCLSCHSPKGRAPWYAALRPAKQLIAYDMRTGTEHFDLEAFMNPPAGKPFSEAGLAKLEYVIQNGDMPPPQFLSLHWNARVSSAEKAAIERFIQNSRRPHATMGVAPEFSTFVLQPLPTRTDANPARAALGKTLFHDTRLSRDNTVSCATCHDLAKGGTDRLKFSKGVRDQAGPINSPTVYNSHFNFVQFWDGRARDLKEQAGGPVTNPKEMDAEWNMVIARLRQDPAIHRAFASAYRDGVTPSNVQDAIAEFEKTLVTSRSRFDRYLRGEKAALNDSERAGLALFLDKGCQSCHMGKNLGGQSFEKMGAQRDYFADRGGVTDADLGRFNVTRRDQDRYYLKVPTLRNVELTYPYFHDGSTSDLAEAVRTMGRYQLGESLTKAEVDRLTAFLKTLTDETLK